MSRSIKYPMYTLSRRFSDNVHRRVRKKVKAELRKGNPNIEIIEGTPRTMGMEDWGTKMGFDTTKLLDEIEQESCQRMMRK